MTTPKPKTRTREELLTKLEEDIAVVSRWVAAYPSVVNNALLRDLNRVRLVIERGADVQPVKEDWLSYLKEDE